MTVSSTEALRPDGVDLAVVETVLPPSSTSSLLMLLRGLADRINTGVEDLWFEGGVAGDPRSAPWLVVLCIVLGLR